MLVKPGYKTSEFWFTLVSFVFSGLFLLGFIGDNAQKEELIRDVSHGVESIILIGGQLLILYNYISSRKTIKSIATPQQPNTEIPKNGPEHTDSNTSNKSRSNKNRSKKTNRKNKTKPG